MSTVTVKDVQRLNKRIEDINTERTRVETRTQMLKDQILKDIKEYKKQFGVDLSASSFSEIKKLVAEESKAVSEAVEKEYKLKEQVVECIESGDIDGANRLLGVVVDEPEPEHESVEEEVTEASEAEELSVDMGSLEEDEDPFFSEDLGGAEKEIDLGESESEEGSQSATIPADLMGSMEDDGDVVVEDDWEEEDDPFGFGSMLNGGKF